MRAASNLAGPVAPEVNCNFCLYAAQKNLYENFNRKEANIATMFLTGRVVGSSPTEGARGEVLIKQLMGAFLFCENVSFFP